MTSERDTILDLYKFLLKTNEDRIKTENDMILIELGFMGGLAHKISITLFGILTPDIMNIRKERFRGEKNERTV